MSDLFTSTKQPRHGHPNILLLTDIDSGLSRDELRKRHERGDYRGCHEDYLREAGVV